MKISDYFGFCVFAGFGVWWLLFPNSVIRFYRWFHRGQVKLPAPFGVRLAGALWIALMSAVMLMELAKR